MSDILLLPKAIYYGTQDWWNELHPENTYLDYVFESWEDLLDPPK